MDYQLVIPSLKPISYQSLEAKQTIKIDDEEILDLCSESFSKTVPIDYLLQTKVLGPNCLIDGVDLSYLSFILFIAVIAGITQLVEMTVEKYSPSLYSALGIFLPLIAVNCAIMGASLFMQQRINLDPTNTQYIGNVVDAIVYAVGSGLGWTLAIVLMGAIREKLQYSDVPKPLQGLGITFITVGLMAMAMMVFSGLKI